MVKKSKVMKEALAKAKELGLDGNVNPKKLLDQVKNDDVVVAMNKMAKSIDDSIMMLQEHLIIVQKNQKVFEEYFQEINKIQEDIQKEIKQLKK